MKRLLFYDLDGTLVDTRKDICLSVHEMLKQMHRPPMEDEIIHGFVGKGLFYLIEKCLATTDQKEVERGAKYYRNYYAQHMLDHTHLYEGCCEVLDYFSARHQCVVTNKPNPFSRDILEALGILNYFFEVIAGDSEYPKKPDPRSVRTCMQQKQVIPEEALFLGDSLIDIETARNAGIETVVLTHGFTKTADLKQANPDYMTENFDEFLELAKQKGW